MQPLFKASRISRHLFSPFSGENASRRTYSGNVVVPFPLLHISNMESPIRAESSVARRFAVGKFWFGRLLYMNTDEGETRWQNFHADSGAHTTPSFSALGACRVNFPSRPPNWKLAASFVPLFWQILGWNIRASCAFCSPVVHDTLDNFKWWRRCNSYQFIRNTETLQWFYKWKHRQMYCFLCFYFRKY